MAMYRKLLIAGIDKYTLVGVLNHLAYLIYAFDSYNSYCFLHPIFGT
ncbi:MAG: hypothetical protein ACJAXS_003579 [Colwellia sp.]|jgi:hypothetical protein